MPEAVILVGLQGAGKTTFYREHLAGTHALISGDVQGTPARQTALLRECLSRGRSFAVDNTNATRAARLPFIQRSREAGYRVICVYLDVPVRTAIGRNNRREDKKPIPVVALLRTAKALEPPSMEEGFDDIQVIRTPSEIPPQRRESPNRFD